MTAPEPTPAVLTGMKGANDKPFAKLVQTLSFLVLVLLMAMTVVLFIDALPAIRTFGISFLVGSDWDPVNGGFGALPFIYGTVMSSLVAILLAAPTGIGVAIFITEGFLPPLLRQPVSIATEMLAAIPSVVYGLWGIFVLIPILRPFMKETANLLGVIPLLAGPTPGPSIFVTGVLLAVMILPTIIAISRDVLRAVPETLRLGSMALGATQWETIFSCILPAAAPGIMGSVILALGRALGETMAATMVIGNTPQIQASLFAPGYTLAAVLANEFAEAITDLHTSALIYAALVLLGVTLALNILAQWLVLVVSGPNSERGGR
ncbi:phosphate ABC transporter permease subunit PstC [Anthocerotibacter panamensis]|uniref:phosphate ABC transporter permease subunit PstC n=1 Tax=Anthocerotibacter panamensis TaxID=2857077 RepID=UPI001C4076C7|nr:phosphate ABC transporter permease subunit PstC [Anthocerotibacter panamensis]